MNTSKIGYFKIYLHIRNNLQKPSTNIAIDQFTDRPIYLSINLEEINLQSAYLFRSIYLDHYYISHVI